MIRTISGFNPLHGRATRTKQMGTLKKRPLADPRPRIYSGTVSSVARGAGREGTRERIRKREGEGDEG